MLKHAVWVFVFSVCLNCLSLNAEEFKPHRLKRIDESNQNYLFRGNVPIINGKFAYQQLLDAIADDFASQGEKFPENPELIVVSLLNPFLESKEINIEKKWFKKNPDKGDFHLNSLYGSLFDPCSGFMGKTFDDPDALSSLLLSLLNTSLTKPRIVYFHCRVGKDRTGEAAAAYNMRYKSYSHKKAMQENEEVARRRLRKMSLNAIKKDAFYLKDDLGYTTIGEIDCFLPLEIREQTVLEFEKKYRF